MADYVRHITPPEGDTVRTLDAMTADAFEAFLGALYIGMHALLCIASRQS